MLKGVMTSVENLEFGRLQAFTIWLINSSLFHILFFFSAFYVDLLFDIGPLLIYASGSILPLRVTKEDDSSTKIHMSRCLKYN